MIAQSAFAELLGPGLARHWFAEYFRPRRRYERHVRYTQELEAAFTRWQSARPPFTEDVKKQQIAAALLASKGTTYHKISRQKPSTLT